MPEKDKPAQNLNHDIWVYYFDSMSTRIREFRTIKGAEFYVGANYILNPTSMPSLPKIPEKDFQESKLNIET